MHVQRFLSLIGSHLSLSEDVKVYIFLTLYGYQVITPGSRFQLIIAFFRVMLKEVWLCSLYRNFNTSFKTYGPNWVILPSWKSCLIDGQIQWILIINQHIQCRPITRQWYHIENQITLHIASLVKLVESVWLIFCNLSLNLHILYQILKPLAYLNFEVAKFAAIWVEISLGVCDCDENNAA